MTSAVMHWIRAHPVAVRSFVAGPMTIAGAIVVMAAMPLWFPPGIAGIDHLILPILLLPGIWAALFFHAILAANVWTALWVQLAIILINGGAALMAASGGA